jgi:hypothetical protein
MKTLVPFLIAALTLTTAGTAVAKCFGCGSNGVLLNGIWDNGVWGNGTSYQGVNMQGTRTHGAEVTIGSADLVRIELPR